MTKHAFSLLTSQKFLHVDWQQEIAGLLQEIVQTTNPHSMLVIATHSPEVMNHMDHIIDFSNRLEA